MRRKLLQRRKSGFVICSLRIAQGDVVERGFGELGLDIEDNVGGGLCICFSRPGKLEHIGDVNAIFLASLFEPGLWLEVVIAIRETESAGVNIGNDLAGIVVVRGAGESEGNANSEFVEAANDSLDV